MVSKKLFARIKRESHGALRKKQLGERILLAVDVVGSTPRAEPLDLGTDEEFLAELAISLSFDDERDAAKQRDLLLEVVRQLAQWLEQHGAAKFWWGTLELLDGKPAVKSGSSKNWAPNSAAKLPGPF